MEGLRSVESMRPAGVMGVCDRHSGRGGPVGCVRKSAYVSNIYGAG